MAKVFDNLQDGAYREVLDPGRMCLTGSSQAGGPEADRSRGCGCGQEGPRALESRCFAAKSTVCPFGVESSTPAVIHRRSTNFFDAQQG